MVTPQNAPATARKTICLVMIVRNEEAVIRRCLESVRPFIDHWVICDTGSTDDTLGVIRRTLAGIPGELHETPWRDFGHNRTVALNLARGKADYHLLLDGDMTLAAPGDFRSALTADSYLVRYAGALDYWVERVVSDRHAWEYVGPAHEYIRSPTATTRAKLADAIVTHHGDGGCQRGKIERYLASLKEALEKDPDNARHLFYIAESYRDLGNVPQAIEWYEKRAAMGGWDEEQWYSLYQIAQLQQWMGIAWPLVLEAYLRAYAFRPTRLEPLCHIARFYRENQQYQLGYLFSRVVTETPYPDDILFVERSVYEYALPMEYAICCDQLGKHQEAVAVFRAVLTGADVPAEVRETARKNSQISAAAMRQRG